MLAGCKSTLFVRLFARCWGLVLKRCGGGWDEGQYRSHQHQHRLQASRHVLHKVAIDALIPNCGGQPFGRCVDDSRTLGARGADDSLSQGGEANVKRLLARSRMAAFRQVHVR